MNPARRKTIIGLAALLAASLTAQAQQRARGLKLVERQKYQSITRALVPLGGGALPVSVDLSPNMPPVGDQGNEESCTAWSAAYAIRTYLARNRPAWDVRSPAHQFSPAFVYNQLARGNCNVGLQMTQVLDLLTNQGATTLDSMPYVAGACANQPQAQQIQEAARYRIGGYRRLNEQDLTEIKAQLAAQFPVLIAVELDDSFVALGPNQIWQQHSGATGYHAVALVGYDDSNRAFKLINSWGSGWGTDGYGFISYDVFTRVVREAYLIAPFTRANQTASNPSMPPATAPQGTVNITGMAAAAADNPGLWVSVRYSLRGFAGHTGQLVLHFTYPNGQGVASANAYYVDAYGLAATGTPAFAIPANDYQNIDLQIFIPVSAFAIPPSGYVWNGAQWVYQPVMTNLLVRADLFIDNFGVAQSGTYPFSAWR